MPSEQWIRETNLAARFEPMDPDDRYSQPYIEIAGVYVWVRVDETGTLLVSVGTEEAADEICDGDFVNVEVRVQGDVVFRGED